MIICNTYDTHMIYKLLALYIWHIWNAKVGSGFIKPWCAHGIVLRKRLSVMSLLGKTC